MRSWFVCFGMFAFVAVCMAVGAGELLADGGGSSVTFTPIVDLSGIFSSLTGVVSTIVAAAITLALGIWGTRYLFRLVKSMGR